MDGSQRKLLLLSNSRNAGQEYLEHAVLFIRGFLRPTVSRILFIPYAAVIRSFDDYESLVHLHFSKMGFELSSIHRAADPKQAVQEAEAIAVGGGNTFQLLKSLHEADILAAIRERALAGVPYIGWSAGSNVACPTIRTTNDMPIVEPRSLSALGLVPFQINPHYIDSHPEGHQGETREERILEFIEVNPHVPVIGLREGSALKVEGQSIELLGPKTARLFMKGKDPHEYSPGDFAYPEGSPVMIIERRKSETASTVELEKPLPSSPAPYMTEPAPSDLDQASPESDTQDETKAESSAEELPKTGSPFPLIGLSGILSRAAAGLRFRRR